MHLGYTPPRNLFINIEKLIKNLIKKVNKEEGTKVSFQQIFELLNFYFLYGFLQSWYSWLVITILTYVSYCVLRIVIDIIVPLFGTENSMTDDHNIERSDDEDEDDGNDSSPPPPSPPAAPSCQPNNETEN